MGTWGTSIFADDLAADVRGDWTEALEDGLDPEAATAKVIARYQDSGPDDDSDDGPTFWLALAAAQTATGRLQPEVRDRALELIASGADVSRFTSEDPRLGRKRERVLAELRDDLLGPQRPPTRVRRPTVVPSPAVVGDLVVVRGSGEAHRDVWFLVVGIAAAHPRGCTAPELLGLRFEGRQAPTTDEAMRAPFLRGRVGGGPTEGNRISLWMVQGPSRGPHAFKNHAAVVRSGILRPDIPERSECGYFLTMWRNLASMVDAPWFADAYGLSERQ